MDRRIIGVSQQAHQELLKFKLQLQVKLGRNITYSEVIKYLLENQRGI